LSGSTRKSAFHAAWRNADRSTSATIKRGC